jgi:uncharacterized coiled-coil protein SlyX
MKKRFVVTTGLVLLFFIAGSAEADDVAELKEQLIEQQKMIERQNEMLRGMAARLEQLESQQQQTDEAMEAKITQAVEEKKVDAWPANLDWVKNLKISGDLRYRHENIDAEGGDNRWGKGRTRHRVRARLMVKAMINGDWDLIFRLASGGSSPTSTNQTLTDGFSSKEIRLDLAYFDWHPASIDGLNVFGGKMKFPLFKAGGNQLIWDGDLTPEGLAVNYKMPLGDSGKNTLYFNGGAFWAQESGSGVDQSMWAAQTYLKHAFDEDNYLLGGVSYYDFGNVKGKTTIYDSQDGFGNTTFEITPGGDLGYVSDYDLIEFFGEYGTKIDSMPVSVFGTYVKNTVANSGDDTGWLIGGKLNKAKKPGSWEASYDYRVLEADAVLGVFSDSDFIGGGTDGKGHRFGFKYQFTKQIQGGLTYFLNERGPDNRDYRRFMADFGFKF